MIPEIGPGREGQRWAVVPLWEAMPHAAPPDDALCGNECQLCARVGLSQQEHRLCVQEQCWEENWPRGTCGPEWGLETHPEGCGDHQKPREGPGHGPVQLSKEWIGVQVEGVRPGWRSPGDSSQISETRESPPAP